MNEPIMPANRYRVKVKIFSDNYCSSLLITCNDLRDTRLVPEGDGKLDRVGPVDNRPSTDKLHHFVKKKYIYIYNN